MAVGPGAGYTDFVRRFNKSPEVHGSNMAGQVLEILARSDAAASGKKRGQNVVSNRYVQGMRKRNLLNVSTRGMGESVYQPTPYDTVRARAQEVEAMKRPPLPAGGLRQYWNYRG